MSQTRKLPIGIQSFAKLREQDCYYVDKTPLALRLIRDGNYYFLSRPRRFGKSLFLDTLKELFEGNQPLFRGLHAERHWDWSRRHPVIRISLADGVLRDRAELDQKIGEILADNEARLGVRSPHDSISGRLHGLIREIHAHTGQWVVLLVDEYDKPILDNITSPDIARVMRDGLLLGEYTHDPAARFGQRLRLLELLQANDLSGLKDLFHAFYASIPHDRATDRWYRNSPIARYEGYYASVFYSYFAALGLEIVLEDVTQQGRIDMSVRFNGRVYLFEFKVVELAPEGRALAQLKDRGYADKYRALKQPIHLIGVEFSKDTRNIVGFEVETV
jgi:hypothetical protein